MGWRDRKAQLDAEAQRRRDRVDDDVLATARRLSPADKSVEARQIRETAASIRDHRSSARRR